jgi:hypothetical protein
MASYGVLRDIADPEAEAARLAGQQAAGAGIREGTVLPVTVGGTVRQYRVTAIDVHASGCVSVLCIPQAAGEHDNRV